MRNDHPLRPLRDRRRDRVSGRHESDGLTCRDVDRRLGVGAWIMSEVDLLQRITVNPDIFGGKPIVRGRRLAVEHVLGMLAAGDTAEDLLAAYPWLERVDILACLVYARRVVGHERVEPRLEIASR
jgi:uncharacterized protein (DUF433 family)